MEVCKLSNNVKVKSRCDGRVLPEQISVSLFLYKAISISIKKGNNALEVRNPGKHHLVNDSHRHELSFGCLQTMIMKMK